MKKYYQASEAFAGLSAPVWRASTVVFDDVESFIHRKSRLEGGRHCAVTPSGQAALCLAVMAFVQAGDHLLISAASYGALKTYAEKWLARLGVEVEYYPPAIAHEISRFIRPNTKMICAEAPGTVTMEMSDIPAIVTEAKKQGVMTMMDNTWASPLGFRPLEHGVDLCVEAATKFFGGHSDLLLGAVITNDAQQLAQLRETQSIMGLQTSPDDCFLVLRGLETFELRYRRQSENAMTIATWLQQQPEVRDMLFPCLPGDQGHEVWKRDFAPGGCLFSFTLKQDNEHAYRAFFAALEHLVLGASWGGVHSLIAFYPAQMQRDRVFSRTDRAIIRLSAGLEDPELIIQDLKNALRAYVQACN